MANDRHLSDTKHFKLLQAIASVKKTPCEDYPDYMFPEEYADPDQREAVTKIAKALCRQCPIIEECFTYALETDQKYGIWGGTSPGER